MFVLKLSECKWVEFSAAILDDFANLKSFCSTWMVLAPLSDFYPSSLNCCCKALSCSLSMSWSSAISIASTFLLSNIWCNLSSSSINFVAPLSLAAFSASLCSYLSCCIFKREEIVRVASFKIVLSMLYCKSSNWSIFSFWDSFASLDSFISSFSFREWWLSKIIPYMKKWWFQFLLTTIILQTWWLMFSSPFFVCLVYSSSFDTIYFSLTIQSSVYYSGQFFLYEIPAKEQSDFQLYFRCIWFFFTWESFVLSSVLFL